MLGTGSGAVAGAGLLEGVGAMGVAGTVDWLEAVVEVLEKLDGTFQCLLKLLCCRLMLLKLVVCLVRLSKYP